MYPKHTMTMSLTGSGALDISKILNVSFIQEVISCKNAVEKIINHLMKVTQRNGAIDMCQGDTHGIGNYSSNFGYMPFVQGLTLVLIDRYKHAGT